MINGVFLAAMFALILLCSSCGVHGDSTLALEGRGVDAEPLVVVESVAAKARNKRIAGNFRVMM